MPSQGKGNRLDASEMTMMRLTLPYIVFFLMFICAKNVANAAGGKSNQPAISTFSFIFSGAASKLLC